MFGITGKLGGTDWRNSGSTVAPSVNSNIVIFTNNNTDLNSSWSTITQGNNRLIRARNESFVDVGIPSNGISASFNFSTGSNGGHYAENYSPYATPYEQNSGNGGTVLGYGGAHSHGSVKVIFSTSNFPSYGTAYMRKRNPNSSPYFTLPVGTILFGENLDNISGVSGYSSYSNRYLMGGEGVSFGGSSSVSLNSQTSTAGDHSHPSYGNSAVNGVFGNFAEVNRKFVSQNSGTVHFHTLTANFSLKNTYVKLRTYVTNNSNVVISKGMIFGFVSAVNDPDWFCCNGQTVKGYTTPNLVDRFIMCGDSTLASHNARPSYADDVNKVTYLSSSTSTESWKHRHGDGETYPASTSLGNGITIYRYHADASITHSHTSVYDNTNGNTFDFEPTHFNLIFYIYLP